MTATVIQPGIKIEHRSCPSHPQAIIGWSDLSRKTQKRFLSLAPKIRLPSDHFNP